MQKTCLKGVGSVQRVRFGVVAASWLILAQPLFAFQIMGAGAQTCEKFIAHISKTYDDGTPRQMEDIYFSWAQGWMSQLGRKREIKSDSQADLNPRGFGFREQQEFLKTTCLNEPRIRYRDAVDRLYERLLMMTKPIS